MRPTREHGQRLCARAKPLRSPASWLGPSLAITLVIGFALHNATKGFGIAAPLASGDRASRSFLGALGLIGGGPTVLGGMVGYAVVSSLISTAFLGLAASALVLVFNEMTAVMRRFSVPTTAYTVVLLRLLVGFGTDSILTAAGVYVRGKTSAAALASEKDILARTSSRGRRHESQPRDEVLRSGHLGLSFRPGAGRRRAG